MNKELYNSSLNTLNELVTPEGIYASSAKGNQGVFYGFFGRDTVITSSLILEAEKISKKQKFGPIAASAVVQLGTWQGEKNNPETGEEVGKISHEVRLQKEHYQHLANASKPWYVDDTDGALKNWDGVDSTALWAMTVMKYQQEGLIEVDATLLHKLKLALTWCLENSSNNNCSFGHDPHRRYGGLYNKGWKDSLKAHLDDKGNMPHFPIRDVWVTGLHWAALKYGARMFRYLDTRFALLMETEAARLKNDFNSIDAGFLAIDNTGEYYFVEAIDGQGNKLEAITIDPALNLWAQFEGECIIDQKYIESVVNRIMRFDMYDPEAGVRVYSDTTKFYDELEYHRGPATYWPFTNALLAIGLRDFGYITQAQNVLEAMIKGVGNFNHCIELFMMKDGRFVAYKDPFNGQESCSDQAWTAAGLYYAFALDQSAPTQYIRRTDEEVYELA